MWQCPDCKRVFRNTNQNHFCGKMDAIDQYIAAQPAEVQPILTEIREAIRAAAPNAVEKMSWQMPTFWQGENLIHFAAFKKHIGVYPGEEAVRAFAERLAAYETSKGAIRFPLHQPVDYALIADIARWHVQCAERKDAKGGLQEEQTMKQYEYEAVLQPADKGGAFVTFPYDLREAFGKGRVKVHATFDGEPYDGSIVNMGVQNEDGSVCYIIGVRKDIRAKIGKQPGDRIRVTIQARD